MGLLRFARQDDLMVVWVVALAVVGADVATKLLARALLPETGLLLLPWVALRVVDNARGPFGLGSLSLTILASIVVLFLLVRNFQLSTFNSSRRRPEPKPDSQLHQSVLGLVAGGGISNLGERLLFGQTTDLIVLGNLTALNVADLAIIVGLVLFALSWRGSPPGAFARAQAVQRERKAAAKRRLLALFDTNPEVTNDAVQRLLGVSDATATNYLDELEREGAIRQVGQRGRGVVYVKNG